MARGIESLVSLNPFCPVESVQGGNADNCKFWLLDLGRCPPLHLPLSPFALLQTPT